MLSCFISALSGAVLFQQDAGGLLSFVALVPFFYALVTLKGKAWWGGMLLFSFLWSYLGIWWLNTLVVFHPLVPLGVIGGGIYLSLFVMIFAVAARWALARTALQHWVWILPGLWVGQEFLRNLSDMAFPWNLMGHTLAPFPKTIQIASLTGVYGVSFLIVGINAAVAAYLYNKLVLKDTVQSKKLIVSCGEMALLTVMALGVWSVVTFNKKTDAYNKPAANDKTLSVAVGQPNTSQLDKWNAMMGQPGDTQETYTARNSAMDLAMQQSAVDLVTLASTATQELSTPPQLVVLPESVFLSSYFSLTPDLQNGMARLSHKTGADILFGADNQIDKSVYTNAFKTGRLAGAPDTFPIVWPRHTMPVRLDDRGTTVVDHEKLNEMVIMVSAWQATTSNTLASAVYNKRQLVPFGEMTPFVSGIPFLANFLESSGIAGSAVPGFEPTIFETAGIKYGTMICFESSFSYLAQDLVNKQADFLTVITNDAWYNPRYAIENGGFWSTLFKLPVFSRIVSAGPAQHLAQSVYRAVETDRSVIRSANSGISATITPQGTIKQRLAYDTTGIIRDNVIIKSHAGITPYTRYGNILPWICTAGLALTYALILRSRLRRKAAE